MKYLEVNRNYKDIVNIIKERIETETPFCFTRYGDGDIRILNDAGPVKFRQKICNLWGYELNDWPKVYSRLRKIMLDSLKESEFIGLFDNNGVLKSHMTVSKETWSISEDFLKLHGIKQDFQICDHQLPRSKEIGDIKEFKKILNGKNLHIISPYTKQLKANNIDNLLGASVTYTEWPMPLNLDQRPQLFKELDNIKESVIIFGAAAGGKDIGSYLTNKYGKVCIDFGATLDAWAGITSRGWFKPGGVQNYCLIP